MLSLLVGAPAGNNRDTPGVGMYPGGGSAEHGPPGDANLVNFGTGNGPGVTISNGTTGPGGYSPTTNPPCKFTHKAMIKGIK